MNGKVIPCSVSGSWIFLMCLVLVEHVVEGLVELAGHGVDLQLLSDDLILQLVDPEVEFADVHLGVLGPAVRLFQPAGHGKD